MAVYTVEAPDGKRLTLEGPPGASEADIFAQAQRLYQPTEIEPVTPVSKPEEEKSGFLRQAADVPLKFGQGAVMGVRMLSDAFGADSEVSKTLRGAEDYIGNLMSAQSKNDAKRVDEIMRDAEDKGLGEQVKAGLKALTVAPIDLVSQALGTSAPIIAGSILAAYTAPVGAAGAAALGTGVGLGAVSGAGTIKSDIHETVKGELLAAGIPEEKAAAAAEAAQAYGGKNLDQILLGTLIGGAAGATGVEAAAIKGLASKITGKLVAEEAVEGMGKRALRSGAEEAATESVQEGQEQVARNTSLQREGFDVPTWRGVASSATLGGALGALTGAGVGAVSRPEVAPDVVVEEEEEVVEEAPAETRRPRDWLREQYTDEQWERVKEYRKEKGLDPETGEPLKERANGTGATGTGRIEESLPPVDGADGAGGLAASADVAPADGLGNIDPAAGPVDGGTGGSSPALDEPKKRGKKKAPAATRDVEEVAQFASPAEAASSTLSPVQLTALAHTEAKNSPQWKNLWFRRGAEEALGLPTTTNAIPKGKANASYEAGKQFVETVKLSPPVVAPEFGAADRDVLAGTPDRVKYIDAQDKAPPTAPQPDLKDLRKAIEKRTPYEEHLPVLVGHVQHLNNLMHDQGEHVDDSVVQGVIAPAVDAAIKELGAYVGKDLGTSPYTADNTALAAWEAKQASSQLEENPEYQKDVAAYLATNPKRQKGDLERFKYRAREKTEDVESPFALSDNAKAFSQWPAFKRYVASHTKTQVKNDAQQLARDAATAIGRGLFNDAATNLHALRELVSHPKYLEEHRRTNRAQSQDDAQLDLKKEDKEIRAREKAEKRAARQAELAKNKEAKEEQRAREAYEADRIKRAAEVRDKGKVEPAKPKKKFVKAVEKAENERALPVKEVLKGMGLSPEAMAQYEAKTKELNEKRAVEGTKGVTEKVLAEKGQRRSLKTDTPVEGEELTKGVFSEEFAAEREAVKADLMKRLKAVNLGHIALVVADKILYGDTEIIGQAAYDVISVALSANDRIGTLNHEIIHVLKALDLFTDKEWAVLERRAKNEWMGRYKIAKAYPNLSSEQQLEEAIAEAFRDSAAGKYNDGFVAKLLSRLLNFLHAVREALSGHGFNNTESIFAKIEKGEVATRKATPSGKRTDTRAMQKPANDEPGVPSIQGERYRRTLAALQKNADETERRYEELRKIRRGNRELLEQKKIARKAAEDAHVELELYKHKAGSPLHDFAGLKFRVKSPDEQASSIGELMRDVRSSKDALGLLKNMYEAMSVSGLGKILYVLTTEDITRWFGGRINQLEDINENIRGMAAKRAAGIRDLSKASEAWVEFMQKSRKGSEVLADLIHQSTLNNFNVSDYSSLVSALKNDPVLHDLWQQPVLSPKEITKREEKIKEIWGIRNKLMQYENGKGLDIYKDALDYYKKTFDAYYNGLVKNIEDIGLEGTDKEKALAKVDALFENARKVGVYAPLSRFGNYWLRIGDGEHFEMFESATARNAAEKKWEEYLQKKKINKTVKTGDNPKELREKTAASDAMLRDLFALVDKKSPDADELKDRIFQMYLANLPGSDIRKSMLHRKGTPGFDKDALRVFIAHNLTAANQLAKLEYGDKIRNSISEAYDALEPHPADDTSDPKKGEKLRTNYDILKLKTVIAHMEKVVNKEMVYENPNELNMDNLARLGNKAVFYYMLSAPKSALVQATQLPVVGFPVLVSRYGLAKTMKVAARYSNFINKLGVTKKPNGKMGWTQPTVINSSYITNMKDPKRKADLEWGFQQAIDKWDLFMNTYTADMTARSHKSSASYESPVNKGLGKVAAIMSGGFHHMERMSREIMYMSSYELALDSGKTREEAADAAADAVYASLFNYTVYNKPLLMKSGAIPRIATQFMTFPVQMTSYLIRNSLLNIKNITDKEQRKSAAIQFFGTLGMTTMFAGVVGLPGYSLIMGLAEGIKNAMKDDDDDELDEDNPLAAKSLKLWFEESFIPDFFGKGSSIAKSFGLTDEQANTLQRSVKMGPISGLTDLNIGSSVSLDGLWFRNDNPEKSSRDAFTQMAYDYGLGAFGSMVAQGGAAIDDFEAGHWDRGIEKLLPAFFRGGAKALRFASEGNLTREGAEVRDAEWYTTGRLMAQTLNISSSEVDELQKKNFAAKRIVAKMQKERTKILSALDMAYRKDDEDGIDAAFEAVDEYNIENPALPITMETINRSLKGHAEARDRALEGLITDPDLAAYFDEMFEKSRN